MENIRGIPNLKYTCSGKGVMIKGEIENDNTGDMIEARTFVRIRGAKTPYFTSI